MYPIRGICINVLNVNNINQRVPSIMIIEYLVELEVDVRSVIMSKVEFNGVPSGDFECFCWEVDLETYMRITGEEPSKFDKSVDCRGDFPDVDEYGLKNNGGYKLYPDDVLQYCGVDTRHHPCSEYTFVVSCKKKE